MKAPTTREELDEMIRSKMQENIHLDYKDSRALDDRQIKEIAKDVSAFANSDGGVIVYGMQEKGHLPVVVDGGVDHSRFSRERLEQIILSNISPRLSDVIIHQIEVSADRSAYSVVVPKSYRGPHQNNVDKKYYRRYNFVSVAMDDYEINDIRLRTNTITPLVRIEPLLRHRVMAYVSIENVGPVSAEMVTFSFDRRLKWNSRDDVPPLLKRGLQVLSPGRRFEIYYGSLAELMHQTERPVEFYATASYLHPTHSSRLTDTFYINFEDYLNTSVHDSELQDHGAKIEKALQDLTGQIKNVTERLEALCTIAGSSGLDLSVTSIRNLHHVLAADGVIEKINPVWKDQEFFREALDVDSAVAGTLSQFFRSHLGDTKLSEIAGVDKALLDKMHAIFRLDDFEGKT